MMKQAHVSSTDQRDGKRRYVTGFSGVRSLHCAPGTEAVLYAASDLLQMLTHEDPNAVFCQMHAETLVCDAYFPSRILWNAAVRDGP